MGADLDLDDVVHGYPVARKELDELKAERDRLRALLKRAREEWVDPDYPLADEIDAALRECGK